MRWSKTAVESKNLYLSIDCPVPEGQASPIQELEAIFKQHVSTGDLRRIDKRNGTLEATYWVDLESSGNLTEMVEALENAFPGIGITFIDQQRVPAL